MAKKEVRIKIGTSALPPIPKISGHCVPKENSWWIHREALTSEDARIVETFLHEKYGFDGCYGGGDYKTKYVYAYRKVGRITNP